MLAMSGLSKEYIGAANFVDVDANLPPEWYWDMVKKAGFQWEGHTTGKRLWTPNIIFLTNTGEYMCTVSGSFNTYNHALNIIREVKALNGRYQAATERRECPGNTV